MSKFKKKYCSVTFFIAIAVLILTIIMSYKYPDAVYATGVDASEVTDRKSVV